MKVSAAIAALALSAIAFPALSAEFDVQLLNNGTDGRMVFEPSFLQIQPGDTVNFIATDRGHNAETRPNLIPEGAEPFKGKIGENVSYTFTVPGAYGVVCSPHFAMGMVSLIVVGDEPGDLSKFEAVPPQAKARFAAQIARIGQ